MTFPYSEDVTTEKKEKKKTAAELLLSPMV